MVVSSLSVRLYRVSLLAIRLYRGNAFAKPGRKKDTISLESACACVCYCSLGEKKLLVTVALAVFDVAFAGEFFGCATNGLGRGQNSFSSYDELFVIKTERYLWAEVPSRHHPSPSRTATSVHTKELLSVLVCPPQDTTSMPLWRRNQNNVAPKDTTSLLASSEKESSEQ